MLLLIIFSFIAGVITILSPCILPVLPIVLSSGISGGHKRPLGVVVGFILSFTFFTLFLASLVRILGVPADFLRTLSIVVIFIFGLALVLPALQKLTEKLFTKMQAVVPQAKLDDQSGFKGGLLLGLSLGLIWTPCVGPILASVIALAATSSITTEAVLITFSYSLGTALPMLLITYSGRAVLTKVPGLLRNSTRIQQVFGVLMILVAVGIFFNLDRRFQTYILETFPQYGSNLTQIEDNPLVRQQLQHMDSQGVAAPELIVGGQWFNSPPLKLADLKGKVVLIDFWTYTCINCIRTLPYLMSWHDKYADQGLVIIGVHTPEFEFEKSASNLQTAINDYQIKYPVMQDNDYATWNAYSNRYWPAKYFIDAKGIVRSAHFGEGEYDESEKMIQQLLQEAGSTSSALPINNPTYTIDSGTPETYLGYQRMAGLVSPEKVLPDQAQDFTVPELIADNRFAIGGKWLITSEFARPEKTSVLVYRFNAKDVFLVMRPKVSGTTGKIRIYIDQELSKEITVTKDDIYQLVDFDAPGSHTIQIDFLDSNLELYAFTFG